MRIKHVSTFCQTLAFASFLTASPLLLAQYDNGSVVGSVKDKTGATIPGATVTITNNGTSIAATTKTDASGNYEVPELKVGTYTVTATAPSFSDAVAQNITVSVGIRTRIDLAL
jgi:hypothetical protein